MASREQARQGDHDDFDDLFDYDIDEILNANPNGQGQTGDNVSKKVNLGVDEEIKITRAKRPTVKLDAERLLSPQGLPKLRRTAPEQLGKKLKGKGHEYQDAARILNFYQLWADDLYRKANFKDTMAIVEKLGHTKRVQMTRVEYLDCYRPRDTPEDIEKGAESRENAGEADKQDQSYGAGPAGDNRKVPGNNEDSLFLGGDDSDVDALGGGLDDNELEELVSAEAAEPKETPANGSGHAAGKSAPEDEFDEDFDAMDDWDGIIEGDKTPEFNKTATGTNAAGTSLEGNATSTSISIFGGRTANISNKVPDDLDDPDQLEALYGF
ncbi:replication fork protection component Swi3-domain-containing protein [Kalaharituber pfeilii]|nr:replication fork protection component Swi3-domain-containing protein [Kalaharituber pfeilii]